VARSQSTSTESSEAKSPTTVGITGLEAKQLRSKSLSSLEISSTTPTRGSTTDIDDDSVTALHRAARLVDDILKYVVFSLVSLLGSVIGLETFAKYHCHWRMEATLMLKIKMDGLHSCTGVCD
jgi:hypothetical protein